VYTRFPTHPKLAAVTAYAAAVATCADFRGLFLAGDWIDTGLPATIESAVRSGHRAAEAALRLMADRT